MNSDFGVGWASIWSRGCFWFRLWGGLQTWHLVPAVGWASIIVGVGFVSGLLGVGWGVKSGQSSFEAAPPPQGGCAAYYVCVFNFRRRLLFSSGRLLHLIVLCIA